MDLSLAVQRLREQLNAALASYEPLVIVIVSVVLGAITPSLVGSLTSLCSLIDEKGISRVLAEVFFRACRKIPYVKQYIQKEQAKMIDKMNASSKSKRSCWTSELPKFGLGSEVLDRLKAERSKDKPWQGKCSGTVYIGGAEADEHFRLLDTAYSLFAHTNPLHFDVFPSVVRFEAEVVAMTASMLGSKHPSSGGQVCGNMTSGGSESILMAVKAARDYMRETKGITSPEMIIPLSAHSAYDKAAEYFSIKLKRAAVDGQLRADARRISRLINSNTILLVGSAPGFPHGVIDPIEELGALALQRNICFHVDLCLGGFVLPFARKLGYPIPPFDFSVPGVTSISVDSHKYGLGPKGTSVILYRNHELRRHQFVAVTEWSGGLYVSPSISGSRPGALIAGAWTAMMALGEEGYLNITKRLMQASEELKQGIAAIPGLFVLGEPAMTVIAFGSTQYDIYKVNDILTSKGWSLNALQKPASVHFCVTLQHIDSISELLQDLREAVKEVQSNPEYMEDGMAPLYGAADKVPDRGAIKDILVAYMDTVV